MRVELRIPGKGEPLIRGMHTAQFARDYLLKYRSLGDLASHPNFEQVDRNHVFAQILGVHLNEKELQDSSAYPPVITAKKDGFSWLELPTNTPIRNEFLCDEDGMPLFFFQGKRTVAPRLVMVPPSAEVAPDDTTRGGKSGNVWIRTDNPLWPAAVLFPQEFELAARLQNTLAASPTNFLTAFLKYRENPLVQTAAHHLASELQTFVDVAREQAFAFLDEKFRDD